MALEQAGLRGRPVELPPGVADAFLNLHPAVDQASSWNSAANRDIVQKSRAPRVPSPGASMSNVTREEIAANIAASEARTDTKFAQFDSRFAKIDSRFDQLLARMEGLGEEVRETRVENARTRDTVRTTAIALFFGLAGLFIAIVFGLPSVYDLGASTRDIIRSEVESVTPPPPVSQ